MHWTTKKPTKEGWYWVFGGNYNGANIQYFSESLLDSVGSLDAYNGCSFSSIPIPKPSKKPRVSKDDCQDIICYLNERTGKSFKSTSRKTCNLIQARYNEEFTKEDFFKVIDNQCRRWLKDPQMVEYLRPETLFGTKFEGYLQNGNNLSNQQIRDKATKKQITIQDLMRGENILRNLGTEKFKDFCQQMRMCKDDIDSIVCKVEGTRSINQLAGGMLKGVS